MAVPETTMKLDVPPTDEQAVALRELELQHLRLQYAMGMRQLGFKVIRRHDDGTFDFSPAPVDPSAKGAA